MNVEKYVSVGEGWYGAKALESAVSIFHRRRTHAQRVSGLGTHELQWQHKVD